MLKDNQTRVILLVCLIFVGLFFSQLIMWSSRQGKARVEISVVPSDSTITIDSAPSSPGVHYLSAGSYDIKASRQYFGSDTQTINIKAGEDRAVYLLPEASSAAAQKYLQDHPKEAANRERYGGESYQQISETLGEKYTFLSQLPIETKDFGVYQAMAKKTKVDRGEPALALLVSANNPTDRARAIERIKIVLGIDPSSIEIIFDPESNPFQEGAD